MTRQEKLIQLVAGLGSWTPLGESWNSEEARAKYAVKQLAAIEKVCPATFEDFDVAQAVAAERERCAKIIETLDPFGGGLSGHTAIWAVQQGAAAIRRGGA